MIDEGRISEVIAALGAIKAAHGDLLVVGKHRVEGVPLPVGSVEILWDEPNSPVVRID